jgi:hypothetical protein
MAPDAGAAVSGADLTSGIDQFMQVIDGEFEALTTPTALG